MSASIFGLLNRHRTTPIQVLKMCGDDAEMFVVERIAALVGTRDAASIARSQEVGRRMMRVQEAEQRRH